MKTFRGTSPDLAAPAAVPFFKAIPDALREKSCVKRDDKRTWLGSDEEKNGEQMQREIAAKCSAVSCLYALCSEYLAPVKFENLLQEKEKGAEKACKVAALSHYRITTP